MAIRRSVVRKRNALPGTGADCMSRVTLGALGRLSALTLALEAILTLLTISSA